MMKKRNKQYWLHRITGGVNGKLLAHYLMRNHNLLSIGWSMFSSKEMAMNIQQIGISVIKQAYADIHLEFTKSAHCLLRFVHEMQEGDVVVVPMGANISLFRIVDNVILTNDTIPNEYLSGFSLVRKNDELFTLDGQQIDLGFYRRVEPIALDIPRGLANKDLYRKTKTLHTNINITAVAPSVEELITNTTGKKHSPTPTRLRDDIHLTDFCVHDYKNINYLQLDGLRKINLFVGANNAGKSNLLEAIALYASNGSHQYLYEILRKRNENLEYFNHDSYFTERELLSAFAPFFPQRSVDKMASGAVIRLSSRRDGVQLALKTATYRDDTGLMRLTRLSQYRQLTRNQQLSNLSDTVLVTLPFDEKNPTSQPQTKNFENILQMTKFDKRGIEMQMSNTDTKFNFRYVNCKSLQNTYTEDVWARISMTNREDTILEALRITNERVKKFNFIKVNAHTYLPMILLEGESAKMPLSEMGDGMTHILNIIIALLDCEDGILLLDEAESGLHYLAQFKLWKMIFELANKYNVQIFATTHSNDCVKAFAENVDDKNGVLFRLNNKGAILAKPYYDMSNVIFAIKNNIDLR